jgi:hypothetical protein
VKILGEGSMLSISWAIFGVNKRVDVEKVGITVIEAFGI